MNGNFLLEKKKANITYSTWKYLDEGRRSKLLFGKKDLVLCSALVQKLLVCDHCIGYTLEKKWLDFVIWSGLALPKDL